MVNTIRCTLLLLVLALTVQAQKAPTEGLKKINGTSLFVKTSGKGEPLLIIHGGPGLNQSYLHPHLDALADKYRLIFYDQRASGRSAIPSSDSVTLSFFVNDIEALRKELGIEKINIFSHSWGAIVATQYGMAYPDKVQAMIYCNPVPLSKEFDSQMFQSLKSKATEEDSTSRSMIMGSPDFKNGKADAYQKLVLLSFRSAFHNPDHFSLLKLVLPSNYAKTSAVLYKGLGNDLSQYDYYPRLKALTFPVLILHGEDDAIPLGASTQLQAQLPSASLQVFSKSGHFIFIEESKKFAKEVSTFLDEH